MNRKHFIQSSALTLGALAFQKSLIAQLFQQPAWKIQMLTKEIGIFSEKGGTILFYLGKDGIAVVDAQFPEQSQHLIEELKKQTSQPFGLLINTHHHGDHTSGNIAYKGIVEHVLAHENSKANQIKVAKASKTEDKQLYPDQTYKEVWSQRFGKETITLHYLGAGHTNGDSLVHFEKADIVHMGDLLFNRRHPYVDKANGAQMQNWVQILETAQNKFSNKTRFVFGHAGEGYEVTGTKDDLRAYSIYLQQVLTFVESEIKTGKSRDEIVKQTSIPGNQEWKGDGIQRPLGAAYDELTAK